MNDLFNVDQVAEMLSLHPRTIRRYIRDGQLKASKVGGEWRIRKEDAEQFAGGKLEQMQNDAVADLRGYIDGRYSEISGKYQVCTILDCYVDTADEAATISQIFINHMNTGDHGPSKFEYFYITDERKGRYILWGNPAFVGKVLSDVGEHTKP